MLAIDAREGVINEGDVNSYCRTNRRFVTPRGVSWTYASSQIDDAYESSSRCGGGSGAIGVGGRSRGAQLHPASTEPTSAASFAGSGATVAGAGATLAASRASVADSVEPDALRGSSR